MDGKIGFMANEDRADMYDESLIDRDRRDK